jgi:impB/mucB/samB family
MNEGRIRKIIHVDMDAFYASVEQRDDATLKGKPVAVGHPAKRGVVAAASYEARAFGVRSAMPSIVAARKCAELVFVPPRFDVYREVSKQVQTIFRDYTPLVEPLSLDEVYLDVTDNLRGIPTAWETAKEIRARIHAETKLTASAGISGNKFLAKLASDYRKPNGQFAIMPDQAEAFVAILAAGDEGEIIGSAAQFVDQIGDQIVEPAGLADQPDERLAWNRTGGGEDSGFDPEHPFAPAGGGRQVDEFDVEAFVSAPLATAGGGGHRPYSRNVGRPENSRAAPSKTSRSNSRRAARPVIGAWRAASAGDTQSWSSRRSTIFWAGFERRLGATAIRLLERRERSAARSRAAASAIAPAAAFGQAGSLGVGRRPGLGDRRVGSRIFRAISGTGRGQRSRRAMTMSYTQSAKISDGGVGASGNALNAKAAAFAAAETGSPSPARAVRLAARLFGSTARSSRAGAPNIRPGSRLGGRPAPSRHNDTRVAAGPSASPTAKRRSRSDAWSALRRRILAEAAALCSARRARSAPAAGGSARRTASRSASAAPVANSGSPCPAPPLARAQAGIGDGGERVCCSGVFARVGLARVGAAGRAGARSRGSGGRSARGSRSARITWAW